MRHGQIAFSKKNMMRHGYKLELSRKLCYPLCHDQVDLFGVASHSYMYNNIIDGSFGMFYNAVVYTYFLK